MTEPLHPDDEPLIPAVENDEVIEAPDDQHDPEEDAADARSIEASIAAIGDRPLDSFPLLDPEEDHA